MPIPLVIHCCIKKKKKKSLRNVVPCNDTLSPSFWDQEFRSGLAGSFWFRVSHEVIMKITKRGLQSLTGAGRPTPKLIQVVVGRRPQFLPEGWPSHGIHSVSLPRFSSSEISIYYALSLTHLFSIFGIFFFFESFSSLLKFHVNF